MSVSDKNRHSLAFLFEVCIGLPFLSALLKELSDENQRHRIT
jgi:hypothetical protein